MYMELYKCHNYYYYYYYLMRHLSGHIISETQAAHWLFNTQMHKSLANSDLKRPTGTFDVFANVRLLG